MTTGGTAVSHARIEMKRLSTASFGRVGDKEITLYTLRNARGSEAAVMNFGATLVSLKTADRKGVLADIVLGYDDLEGYVTDRFFFGGTIGRYANRIAQGAFTLNGTTYQLPCNEGANHLHGGPGGFHKAVWNASDTSEDGRSAAVEFNYVSADGEEGYPGDLSVHVTYRLTDEDELWIAYRATSNKDTVVNLTNHSYFNLAGEGCGDILEQQLFVSASEFTPVNSAVIPTGERKALAGTPLDFSKPTAIGARIDADDEQLRLGRGYDHNLVIRRDASLELNYAARLRDPKSGRTMDVYTTEPGIQFYSGNFLDGSMRGKAGKSYGFRSGLCLETQHFPDSPNQPAFPSTVLRAEEQFNSRTAYKFTAK
jgi:aldose 1-epimerase